MNCEQFERRAQQLLDDRANLRLDLPLQQHARDCSACDRALAIFDCFCAMPALDAATPNVELVSAHSAQTKKIWRHRQPNRVRNRVMVAAAALLMISLTLVTRTVTAPATAWFVQPPHVSLASMTEAVDFSGLWAFQEQLPEVPAVDITAISRIDLLTLMPHKPAQVVRNLPATIETIEPIYRYSTEFPMLNQWSSGINYTLGLIQSTLPGPSDAAGAQRPIPELGKALHVDRRHLC